MADEAPEEELKKTYDFFLLLNWKTGDVRVRKTEPKKSKIAPSTIPIHMEIDVVIPEKPSYEAKGTIKVSQQQLEDMVFDSL